MESKIKKIYEDESILVVDKPFGLVVNRSNTAKEGTLQDLVDAEYTMSESQVDEEVGGYTERSGIVHRLDKDTSGIMVISKDKISFDNLALQFKERKTVKEYVTVLCGQVTDPIIEIEAPISRSPKTPLRLAVVEGGRDAFTRFERLNDKKIEDSIYTSFKVFPKTGRTHQIRVHASALGHPIAGDRIYCTRLLLESSIKHFGRMMLHAYKLGFYHPKTDKYIEFTSSIPHEFNI